ncbi:MAG: MFS transporter [Sedimentisphaerales bacterium]|nr:MFS transporter [Sedimentisphaerales bacterium]
MAKTEYLTAPVPSKKMPASMPAIMVTEAFERYAFYAFDAILALYLINNLLNLKGEKANLTEEQAMEWKHYFKAGVYFTPLIGSILSDLFLGKFRTIIAFSVVYCLGFLAITIDQTYVGTMIGLGLISLGAGIIKPCLSANVGDQFGQSNQNLITKAYNIFYWMVNFGAFFSMLISPWIYDKYDDVRIALGIPGFFMIIATLLYWLGRKSMVHIPPKGKVFFKDLLSKEGILIMVRLAFFIFIFIAVFWSLFDQTTSKWVYQAEKMDLTFLKWNISDQTFIGSVLSKLGGINQVEWKILPAQMQAVNSIIVLLAIPLFTYGVYPVINRFFRLTPIRKIGIGFFVAIPSFAIPAMLEKWIQNGSQPTIWWQVLAYFFITAGEVLISIPALEFSYTQAPKSMKSFISSFYLLAVSLGNLFVSFVNKFIQNPDGTVKLKGPNYYWFFTILMFATGIVFCIVIQFYKGKTYIQEEGNVEAS